MGDDFEIEDKTSSSTSGSSSSSSSDSSPHEIKQYSPLTAMQLNDNKEAYRRIHVPPHRYTPLRTSWPDIYKPVVEQMKLQIRFNPQKRCVELKTSPHTELATALQKSEEFVRACICGFAVQDAIALLRLDDLFIDSFECRDVRALEGEHLSRAIGRIAGQGGKTKFTIENSTTTRIVLADSKVHILGSHANIKVAKAAICKLIMGSPPGKVYTAMRAVANRNKEKF